MPSFRAAMETVRTTLAAENGCSVDDFDRDAVHLCPCSGGSQRSPLARRYVRPEPCFTAVTTGTGAVVSGSASLLPHLHELFTGCSRDAVFEPARLARVVGVLAPHGRTLAGPHLRLICGDDTWRERPAPVGISLSVATDPDEGRLLALGPGRWPNAFSVPSRRPQPRLAVAHAGDVLAGVAAVSADTDSLWQIGLDVDERFRGRGIGAALTAALAREALETGSVPFYGVALSNLASIAAALAAGFRPAWMEAYSVEAQRV